MDAIPVTEAIRRINEYLESPSASPFFVIVDGSAEYRSILNALTSLERVRVSRYCNEDSFADYDALWATLYAGKGRRLLLGLGDEIAMSGYSNIIGKIAGLSTGSKLVVLCRRIRAQVVRLNEAERKFNSRRYCEVKSTLDYSVVRVAPVVHFDARPGFRNLLYALEDGAGGELYVRTELPILASRAISAAYEAVLESRPAFPLAEEELPAKYWDEYSLDDRLDNDNYDVLHWRSYLQMRLHPVENPYLRRVMDSSGNYETYRTRLYDALLDVHRKDRCFWPLYDCRKALLRDLPDMEAVRYVAMTAQKSEDRLYYLTDNTEEERHAIISEIAGSGVIPKDIERIYPALGKYLSDYTFTCQNGQIFNDYFKRYKRQKLENHICKDFGAEVSRLASDGNRAYTALDSRNSLVEKLDDGRSTLIWIDALGAEFLGYIQATAKEMGLRISVKVGRAVLPTLTCCNRDFYDDWKGRKMQTRELDDLKHKGEARFNYVNEKFPIHIAEELRVIDKALNLAKGVLMEGSSNSVVIASDHGASRLAVINNHENRWKMASGGKHSGRCCPKNEIDDKPDTATDERGFWVLANYDRFQGGHKARVEVHGGASLEEVLTPVIQIRMSRGKVTLKNMTEVAYSSWDEDPSIEIFSPAHIDALAVRFHDHLYHSVPVREKTHRVTFDGFKNSGTYTADVLDGDNLIGEITFTIDKRSGRAKSEEEDEFFK